MDANRFKSHAMSQAYGDACVFLSSVDFDATAAGESVNFADMPAGSELIKVESLNDPLGAGTTMQYGIEYPDGGGTDDDAHFLPAAASTALARRESLTHPFTVEDRAIITGRLAGGNATGKVTVSVHYRFRGNM